jgi:CubicO group peptidase (beta-lactamase class C family)
VPLDLLAELARAAPGATSNAMRTLDRFIAGYCAAMNAPGLTLGLANAAGTIRTASYGYVDLAAKLPVTTSHLFEIGSISKSFVGLTILQLHDEQKVDLQAPILSYLPWLSMDSTLGEILVHHLLTHSSGMPDDAPLIPSSPERRPRQALKPGTEFHYSNWGYDVLGRLIEAVDGRPWQAAVAARILKPVGMTDTSPTITSASRPRIAQSYMPLHDDRPYPRHGALVPAGNLAVEFAAGSIASTPKDMSLYSRRRISLRRPLVRAPVTATGSQSTNSMDTSGSGIPAAWFRSCPPFTWTWTRRSVRSRRSMRSLGTGPIPLRSWPCSCCAPRRRAASRLPNLPSMPQRRSSPPTAIAPFTPPGQAGTSRSRMPPIDSLS